MGLYYETLYAYSANISLVRSINFQVFFPLVPGHAAYVEVTDADFWSVKGQSYYNSDFIVAKYGAEISSKLKSCEEGEIYRIHWLSRTVNG